jgi:hypothetical protein
MHARFCSPVTGRFLSVDPVFPDKPQLPQSLNKYVYAMGNPMKFVDPTGEKVDLSSLSAEEQAALIQSLNEFTGNTYGISESGELVVVKYSDSASKTATEFLDAVIGSDKVYKAEAVNNSRSVDLMETRIQEGTIRIDFTDFSAVKYGQVPAVAFGLGSAFVHELVHAHLGLTDPPQSRKFYSTGPVVDFVNVMQQERGLPVRGPSYSTQDGKTLTGRIKIPFQNVNPDRPQWIYYVKPKLFPR